MESELSTNDLFAAQSCPDQRYFDLLVETLRSRGTDEAELAKFAYQGKHASRASSSEFPLSSEARELYKVATDSELVTWSQAVRWVEDQGRTEEAILFNQLYTFAWIRPLVFTTPLVRFNPKVRTMEAHDNLYDLADVAKLIYPARRRALIDSAAPQPPSQADS